MIYHCIQYEQEMVLCHKDQPFKKGQSLRNRFWFGQQGKGGRSWLAVAALKGARAAVGRPAVAGAAAVAGCQLLLLLP